MPDNVFLPLSCASLANLHTPANLETALHKIAQLQASKYLSWHREWWESEANSLEEEEEEEVKLACSLGLCQGHFSSHKLDVLSDPAVYKLLHLGYFHLFQASMQVEIETQPI